MLTTLLLTITLAQVSQTEGSVATTATSESLALSPAEQRQSELRRLVEMRRQRHANGIARKQQALGQMQAEASARAAQAASIQVQANQQQSLRNIAIAEQRRAATAEAQYRLNSQVAGAPQVFVPGEGMVPYTNGIAPPWWWGLQQVPQNGQAAPQPMTQTSP